MKVLDASEVANRRCARAVCSRAALIRLLFVLVPLPPTTLPMIAFSIVTSLPVAFPFATLV